MRDWLAAHRLLSGGSSCAVRLAAAVADVVGGGVRRVHAARSGRQESAALAAAGTSTVLLFAGAAAIYVVCALAAVPKQPGIGSPSEWFAGLSMVDGVDGCGFLSPVRADRPFSCAGMRRRHSIVFYALNALMLNAAKLAVFRVLHVNGAALPAVGQWVVGVIVTVLAMLFMAVADLFVRRWMWWSIGGAATPAGRWVRGAHVR